MGGSSATPAAERREFPRLKRPVFYRVPSIFDRWGKIHDVSLGGCRIYSDKKLKPGRELILEVLMPDQSTLRARAQVRWAAKAPEDVEARFEVGLQFYAMPEGSLEALQLYLETPMTD